MILYHMSDNELCTIIYADFKRKEIKIENKTDVMIMRAFGVIEYPTWDDFEYYLEDHCVQRNRSNIKDILKELGAPYYDPLLIIRKTQGRMFENHEWIIIVDEEKDKVDGNCQI